MDSKRRHEKTRKRGRPLLGNFEENILNQRLEPIRQVDGYRVKLKASSGYSETKQLEARLQVSFFSAGSHSFPYLCQADLDQSGHRIPKRGCLQVALFNPHGTLVKLFLLRYDLSDMPANSQTFLRQRQVLLPTKRVQYLIQFNIISSKKSANIYLNKDLKIFICKKADLETASQILTESQQSHAKTIPPSENQCSLESFDEMPANPKYFAR